MEFRIDYKNFRRIMQNLIWNFKNPPTLLSVSVHQYIRLKFTAALFLLRRGSSRCPTRFWCLPHTRYFICRSPKARKETREDLEVRDREGEAPGWIGGAQACRGKGKSEKVLLRGPRPIENRRQKAAECPLREKRFQTSCYGECFENIQSVSEEVLV